MPVFDDGTGEPEIGGHGKDNLAFRKGRLGVAQYMQDRPEAITWERPFQYAGKNLPWPLWSMLCESSMFGCVLGAAVSEEGTTMAWP